MPDIHMSNAVVLLVTIVHNCGSVELAHRLDAIWDRADEFASVNREFIPADDISRDINDFDDLVINLEIDLIEREKFPRMFINSGRDNELWQNLMASNFHGEICVIIGARESVLEARGGELPDPNDSPSHPPPII